jgi:hypothetical protein
VSWPASPPSAIIEPDLVEWNYGKYEGLTPEQIHEQAPGWLIFRDGCPGGETPEQVGARADRVIARANAVDGDVALFAHGHVLRVLVGALARIARGRRPALSAGYGHVERPRSLPRYPRFESLECAARRPRIADRPTSIERDGTEPVIWMSTTPSHIGRTTP